VLAVGIHPGKAPLFSAEERLAMLEEICGPLGRAAGCEIACTTFGDLVVTRRSGQGDDPHPRRARCRGFRL
jgi:pantetheine-phosphate adenylyltransferase